MNKDKQEKHASRPELFGQVKQSQFHVYTQ